MTTLAQHTGAMERGAWQCPQCANGWQKYSISDDHAVCPNCGYAGGITKPSVRDGVVCYVSLKIDAKDALAAHDGEMYRLIEQMTHCKDDSKLTSLMAQEEELQAAIDAARKKINALAEIGLHTLFSMGENPSITHTDKLELRLLLCRIETKN